MEVLSVESYIVPVHMDHAHVASSFGSKNEKGAMDGRSHMVCTVQYDAQFLWQWVLVS